jgi:prepilin-type processing-associated H-X9-DG protein/prepilin-type N-terminal cleavage/methylation domain-containing protein
MVECFSGSLPFREKHPERAILSLNTNKAFTLVELLVVIGIVAALIAMLMPALSYSRAHARSVACQSNLRQWAAAVLAYAYSNKGILPRRGQGVQVVTMVDRPADWFNALPPLFKQRGYYDRFVDNDAPKGTDGSVWSCPEFTITQPHPHQFGYAMNMRLSTWNAIFPDRINRVGPTATLVFMADAPGAFASIMPTAIGMYNPVARHRGRVNIAFLDGHVASLPGEEAGIGRGEPGRADLVWAPPRTPWAGPNP